MSRQEVDQLPKVKAPVGYIYVIKDIDITGYYKIGKTIHPAARLSNFGVKLPIRTEVVLVKKSNNAHKAEMNLHRRFKQVRQRGEWFKLSDSQLDSIFSWNANVNAPSTPEKRNRKSIRRHNTVIRDTGWTNEYWRYPDNEDMDDSEEELWQLDDLEVEYWEVDNPDAFLPEGDIEETIVHVNLAGKDLAGMIMIDLNLSERDLSSAILWGAELSYTRFVNSDLSEADLTDAVLQGANFRGALLKNSNLTGANLRDANLGDANLEYANLTSAELSKADLMRATLNHSTILPDGEPWSSDVDLKRFTG